MSSYTTGLFQALNWDASSTLGSSMSLVTGGNIGSSGSVERVLGISGIEDRHPGMIKPAGTATFKVNGDNIGFLLKVFRDTYPAGVLTPLFIEGGTSDWSIYYPYCYVNKATLKYSADAPLEATCDWMSLYQVRRSGVVPTANTYNDFQGYQGTITIGGNFYHVTDLEISIENNITQLMTGDYSAYDGYYRMPRVMLYGVELSSVKFTTLEPIPDVDDAILCDCPDQFVAVFSATNCDNDVLTVNMQYLLPSKSTMNFVDSNSEVSWDYEFEGSVSGSIGMTFV